MARPAKSVKVKTGALASEEEMLRNGVEERLRGTPAEPEAPNYLTDDQKNIFQFIVAERGTVKFSGGWMYTCLNAQRMAISRIRQINDMVNRVPRAFRYVAAKCPREIPKRYLAGGERALSFPCRRRAKIGSLAAQAAKQKEDPLLKVLMEDD